MKIENEHLVTNIVVDQPVGSHMINIRAKDKDGKWSEFESTVLTVMGQPQNVSPEIK